MANKNPIVGLRPLPDNKGAVNTVLLPISASNASDLFVNSPVAVVSGEVLAVAAYSDGTEKVTGTVVRLCTDAGKTVQNVPDSTDGYKAEITYDPNQRYIITMDGTDFAAADVGKMYSLTAESATANADGFTGDAFSKRQLATSTEAASGEQFVVRGLSGSLENAVATDNVEVVVTINSANHNAA